MRRLGAAACCGWERAEAAECVAAASAMDGTVVTAAAKVSDSLAAGVWLADAR